MEKEKELAVGCYSGQYSVYLLCDKKFKKSRGRSGNSRRKYATYADLLDDYCFVPNGIESFGTWGREGHKLIKEIGKRLKEVTGEKRSTFFLTQRISMTIQRGNSSCVQGTVPSTEGLDEIFELMDHEDSLNPVS